MFNEQKNYFSPWIVDSKATNYVYYSMKRLIMMNMITSFDFIVLGNCLILLKSLYLFNYLLLMNLYVDSHQTTFYVALGTFINSHQAPSI